MKGKWVGTNSGYEQGKSSGASVTFLIDKASGQSFSGSMNYRYSDGRSGEERIQGSIGKRGDIVIADKDGLYVNGILEKGKLYLQYIEASAQESEASNLLLEKK